MPGDPQTGNAFPSNKIGPSRFSRLARVALADNVFPAPTPKCLASAAACGGGLNNYQRQMTLPNNTNQQTYKLDQNLARAGSIFFRITHSVFDNQNPQNFFTHPDACALTIGRPMLLRSKE